MRPRTSALYAVESEGRVPKAQLQRAEAAHIARQLREMLDQGVGVYDAAASTSRPLRPGDIAILSRVWAPLEIYGDALAAAGIPSVHAGGGNLLETREAKDGIVLLRFLADPTDDLALVAVLRSPFFALDDRLLHDLAAEREKGTSWWQLVGESRRYSPRRREGGARRSSVPSGAWSHPPPCFSSPTASPGTPR